jgi:flagellar basal-body rod modification protein FlgD
MSPITPLSNQPSQASDAITAQQTASVQYDSFLRLLTAQVKNQDPLSPLDSTQFVEQLATFSTLEQQVRSNTSLDAIAQSVAELQALFAAQGFGAPMQIESTWLDHSGEQIVFEFPRSSDTDQAILVVRDASGNALYEQSLDLSAAAITWNGTTTAGESVDTGQLLQFTVDLYGGGRFLGSVAPRPVG